VDSKFSGNFGGSEKKKLKMKVLAVLDERELEFGGFWLS
jgi:hypothetical protein